MSTLTNKENSGGKSVKKYLVATACDQKYEDFLLNHWYKSLKENVNLSQTDVLIMDWGLTESAKKKFEGALISPSKHKNEGFINTLRFMDLYDFLKDNPKYEQVILCDGGDIIFQSDISPLFELKSSSVKGVTEAISPNMEILITNRKVRNADKIVSFLKDKKPINAGFVVYPSNTFLQLVEGMFDLTLDKKAWGIDMVLLNYLVYKYHDFYELDSKYNFIPTTAKRKFYIKGSVFYLEDGEIIPVVHNAGNKDFFRSIRNFGYGPGHNNDKKMMRAILRTFYKAISLFRTKR
jgi:hypothetical protein